MIKNAHSLIKLFNSKIKDCNVIVIGDVMLDRYYFGDIKRISPEAPIPIINVRDEMKTPGGAANVANNLAHLGCKVSLVGAVGDDLEKNELMDMLKFVNIDSSGILTGKSCTTTKTRVISGNQQVIRIDNEEQTDMSEMMFKQFQEWILNELKFQSINVIIISDYEKGFCTKELCKFVIEEANERAIPIIIDPKGNDWSKYSNATMITPNLKELSKIIGRELFNTNEVIQQFVPELRKQYNLDYLLVTRSEKGMTLVGEEEIVHIPTVAKEIFDVSGAGDTVISTIAAFIGIGAKIDDAVKVSNVAAGIVVGKVGTYAVRDFELLDKLEELNEHSLKLSSKITSKTELKLLINKWRTNGEKVVFTNGCFDLLHIGHATYLKDARQLGDKLIVGLNSDKSVKNLKGPTRPIINENDRAKMLSFFEFVDAVIIFDENTPLDLISEVKPDILVKGGDYKVNEVVGREFADRVEIISFVDGYSTSGIIKSISYKTSLKV
ncbi:MULTISPECIES: D-glycero-beta-D-manno-heptose-7-phosphate kinase [Bacillus]|uniref:D-glycero-beta-D-manno-heptose-7-phosphate kinase n=1 Tax=Bacillus TaxID=1386 RepID=UPI0002F1AB76|nr:MULTISPECIES: D-glycero-beta-D-manno-heptose-7-phosphate kinase [Bacillus]